MNEKRKNKIFITICAGVKRKNVARVKDDIGKNFNVIRTKTNGQKPTRQHLTFFIAL